MPVHSSKDHAFAVEFHHAVFDGEASNAHGLRDHFTQLPIVVTQLQREVIQVRIFVAPQVRLLNGDLVSAVVGAIELPHVVQRHGQVTLANDDWFDAHDGT